MGLINQTCSQSFVEFFVNMDILRSSDYFNTKTYLHENFTSDCQGGCCQTPPKTCFSQKKMVGLKDKFHSQGASLGNVLTDF